MPALDAIMFLHPRNSQIDVVQSVGRVMRRAPGKKMGYVILPVGIPAGLAPDEALNKNEKYKVVWQILNALRAHDERLEATINKMDLGVDVSHQIEVIAVSNTLPATSSKKPQKLGLGEGGASTAGDDHTGGSQSSTIGGQQLAFTLDDFTSAIRAKIVKKCGRRDYWENWAGDVARIAQTHITRIETIVKKVGSEERAAFERFLAEIRDDLNESISDSDAIEMLAQHLITKPVFEALFEGYSFTKNNPVSVAMEEVLKALDEQNLGKEAETLNRFYASVRLRAAGIDNAEGKQKIVVELYDKFFRNAFPRMTERLGIVYTPVEVVDFIIHSVNDVLKADFGQTLGSKGVHILDPFTGTGTFITRLLQSGLIQPGQLAHKYKHEIHANEIVLLAYYIAAINIEAAYHNLSGGNYKPFEGICLTDTFQLYEQDRDLISDLMADNSNRRTRQKALDIRVIVGNPPYSVGQGSANDDAPNVEYPKLDGRIRNTYAARSNVKKVRSLYDSYIRAIRWASDRIGESGVIGFVTNAGFLESNSASGLRKCLEDEFTSVSILHLRGLRGKQSSGERAKREGGQIFGAGSGAAIAITVLVKNPDCERRGRIRFHDIGDYLTREDKLSSISQSRSFYGLEQAGSLADLSPNEHGDWLRQREEGFSRFPSIGDKKSGDAVFDSHCRGYETRRDAWAYNSSNSTLKSNIRRMEQTYEADRDAILPKLAGIKDKNKREALVATHVTRSPSAISWSPNLLNDLEKDIPFRPDYKSIKVVAYRPFSKSLLMTDKQVIWSRYRMPSYFPQADSENRLIVIHGPGEQFEFTTLMTDLPVDVHALHGSQCFPKYVYGENSEKGISTSQKHFFEPPIAKSHRRDAITSRGLAYFQSAYPGEDVTKDDLFYYTYGLLHSPEYRERYADNLSKELPRIPIVNGIQRFRAFVEAGRKLGDLHVGYEAVEPYPVAIAQGDLRLTTISDPSSYYRVEQMKFAGRRPKLDKTTVIYNPNITITNIPLTAYEYVVNGKPALERGNGAPVRED